MQYKVSYTVGSQRSEIAIKAISNDNPVAFALSPLSLFLDTFFEDPSVDTEGHGSENCDIGQPVGTYCPVCRAYVGHSRLTRRIENADDLAACFTDAMSVTICEPEPTRRYEDLVEDAIEISVMRLHECPTPNREYDIWRLGFDWDLVFTSISTRCTGFGCSFGLVLGFPTAKDAGAKTAMLGHLERLKEDAQNLQDYYDRCL